MRALWIACLAIIAAPSTASRSRRTNGRSKPVTVIVPFAAGGNTDTLARVFADRLSVRLGQQFIIDNRSGAGGITGVAATLKSPPDGYTIGIATASGIAYNPVIMGDKMPYDVEKDVAYLYNMANQPNLLVVHPSVPAKTLPELVAWLKSAGRDGLWHGRRRLFAALVRRIAGAGGRRETVGGCLSRVEPADAGSDRRADQTRV